MKVAVIGGGINGICCAWELARRGHEVDLYERGELMGATSSASSKLLHGGLRYLEYGEFRLVREALRERHWWLQAAPELTRSLRILLPVYAGKDARPRWQLRIGLILYDLLAGRRRLGRHRWLSARAVLEEVPGLDPEGLRGAFAYYDGQMDDHALGLWAARQAESAGVSVHEQTEVERVSTGGELYVAGETRLYDRVVNVAGPWVGELMDASELQPRYRIRAVRGSHLLFDRPPPAPMLLQHPDDGRVVFVLPWQDGMLLGTTEVAQPIDQSPECTDEERDYLLEVYNRYLSPALKPQDISSHFSGLRPLPDDGRAPTQASREYEVERLDRLIGVYGGKWTTARALARQVADMTEA